MIDGPTTTTDQVPAQESRMPGGISPSSGRQSTSPSPGPIIGDPARRASGDKTDDESKRTDPSGDKDMSTNGDAPRADEQDDDDAGEGHKGPRVDATSVSSAREPEARPAPTQSGGNAVV
jgi:hypothetical protein